MVSMLIVEDKEIQTAEMTQLPSKANLQGRLHLIRFTQPPKIDYHLLNRHSKHEPIVVMSDSK